MIRLLVGTTSESQRAEGKSLLLSQDVTTSAWASSLVPSTGFNVPWGKGEKAFVDNGFFVTTILPTPAVLPD